MTELKTAQQRIEELEAQELDLVTLYGLVQEENKKIKAELAAMQAGGEPVANSRPSLEAVFRGLSERAYCNYIEQKRRDVCLGWEYKAAHGQFGEPELNGHALAAQQLGRHRAFAEAANALRGSDAPLTHPQPAAQDAERKRWIEIGQAIERACMTLPEGTEVILSLERDAGTVKWFDGDGNEYDTESHEDGLAGVINDAIDATQQGKKS